MSLKQPLDTLQQKFIRSHPGVTVTINYGSAGSLLRQIENGAPADLFISAATEQMDQLEQHGHLLAGSRVALLSNRLVLISNSSNNTVQSIEDLISKNTTKIAIGEPNSVPVGKYTMQTLGSLGYTEIVRQKLIFAKDVRQVVSYVESGNVDAGFVYATDAQQSSRIRVVEKINDSLHTPIIYPAAIVNRNQPVEQVRSLLQFLTSDTGKTVFEQYGFQFIAR